MPVAELVKGEARVNFHGWGLWFEFLQCFDTVGWATGKLSGLQKPAPIIQKVLF